MQSQSTLLICLLGTLAMAGIARAGGQPEADQKPLAQWVEALDDEDAEARRQAAAALGRLGPEAEAAVPKLTGCLTDRDPDVRFSAAHALGSIGLPSKPAVPALINVMKDTAFTRDGRPVWIMASLALGHVGPGAVPELIAALEDPNPHVCIGAAAALGYIGSDAKTAVGPLVTALEKDDPQTRNGIIHGLQGIGPDASAAVPALTKMLDSDEFHTQYWACRALSAIGPAAAPTTPVLCRLTVEGTASVRRHAAAALGDVGPGIGKQGLDALTSALRDPNSDPVREDAVIALGKLGEFARPAVPAVREALESGRISARVQTARTLWILTGETAAAVEVLIEEVGRRDEPVEAAELLGEMGPPAKAAVPALIGGLQSVEDEARAACCGALGRIGPDAQPAADALEKTLEDPSPEVRLAAQEALRQIRSTPPDPAADSDGC